MNTRTSGQIQKRPSRRLAWLIGILLAVALLGVAGRLLVFGQTQLAGGDQLWRLGIDVSIQSQSKATTVRIYPPIDGVQLHVIQRNLQHPGLLIRNWSEEQEGRRSIRAYATGAGERLMSAEFFVHQTAVQSSPLKQKKTLLTDKLREAYLQDNDQLQLSDARIVETLKILSSQQPERALQADDIFKYLNKFAVSFGQDELSVPSVLEKRKATAVDIALAMVALCRAAGIPSRIITGLILKEDIEPLPHHWVEAYQDEQWLAYDIQAGFQQTVPPNYLPMRRNGTDIVQVLNGELLRAEYDIEREYDHPFLRKLDTPSILNIPNFTRMPVDARNELAILLLLPFGVLITALYRHLVGLHSYGVFTPTLLSLAMVYTDIMTTAIIFIVVCSLAVTGRSLFPESITRTPRLAIIFTLVALLMSLSASVMEYFNLGQGGKVVLLPIIILTSLVDHLYRTIEVRGMEIAMQRLIWTILVTLLCLPVIQYESLGHFMVRYPELHFVTLAIFLLISQYKGRKLIDLPFFKFLAEPEVPAKKGKSKLNTVTED